VKEANLHGQHSIGFQLYDFWETQKYGGNKKIGGYQEWGWGDEQV
jgi:hypothetical protein